MSSNFAFPPPPPPPPKAASSAYPPYPQPSFPAFNGHTRGTHAGGGSSFRGRGDRQRGFRGNDYGQRGHANHSAGQNRSYGAPPYGAPAGGFGEHYGGPRPTPQRQANGANGYPLPQYPQPVMPFYNGGPRPYDTTPQQIGYSNGLAPQPWISPQPQLPPNPAQPSIMGPPIRMGFDREHPPDLRPSEHSFGPMVNSNPSTNPRFSERSQPGRHISPNLRLPNKHVSPNPFPGSQQSSGRQQQKRRGGPHHVSSQPRDSRPRPNAAPSVPSFGGSLPSVNPLKDEDKKKPRKKKKRTHNVLGLTPRQEEHEESEEEDIDEEAVLGGIAGANEAQLQITYKGQTATLGTPSDIAAWIEERKKRFPTKQRVAERNAELQRRREVANESKKVSVKEKGKQRNQIVDAKQLAAEARSKMEKARKKLEREQEKLARAEAAAADAEASKGDVMAKQTSGSKKRKRQAEGNGEAAKDEEAVELQGGDAETLKNIISKEPTRTTKHSSTTSELTDTVTLASGEVSEDNMSISSSSALSDDETTSSSGSSSSDDERPEEAPSKTGLPMRLPPPERVKRKGFCKAFAKTGRCRFQDRCHYSHDIPDRSAKVGNGPNSSRKGAEDNGKSKRKGLYQRFLESEKEKDDLLVIKAIKHLAENGVLDAGGVDGRSSTLQSE